MAKGPKIKPDSRKRAVPPPAPHPTSLLAGSSYSDDLFWRGFRASAGAHAALVILVVILSVALPHEPIKFLPSIRVDLVALPDVKKADLGKIDDYAELNKKLNDASKSARKLIEESKKAVADKKPAPPDDSMALKKEKPKSISKASDKALKNAIERIKALAAIENDDKSSKKPSRPAAKGNQVSKGNSSSGPVATDTNAFIAKMQSRLHDNWNLPVWLMKQNLSAKIVVFLDKQGYVSNTVVAQGSGNKQFDDYCIKTIKMSQPFGEPPSDIVDGGLTLGFPL